MKKITLTTILFSIVLFVHGQKQFSKIDVQSQLVPDSLTSVDEISAYLTNNLHTDIEKARAIYIWITHNIHYDLRLLEENRRYSSSDEFVEEVLINRKGVCQHYSELFTAMSNYAGLKTYLISGYTRDIDNKIADVSHAWNAIKLDSNYFLIDNTWAAGYEQNGKYVHKFRDKYFLIEPKDFIKDHMPFDPIWQFLPNPLSHKDFMAMNFSGLNTKGNFSFTDSIQHYESLGKLDRLVAYNNRIIADESLNIHLLNQVKENNLQITNERYNNAIETFNRGVANYNKYVEHRNQQFRNPKLSDEQINTIIHAAGKDIYSAQNTLKALFTDHTELSDMIINANKEIQELITAYEKEKQFVDDYLETWKPLRAFMFYSISY